MPPHSSAVHLMNHYAHCGKQVPIWSGMPLCPPLGFAFNLHESIPNHEAHHNFHNCGFGLLGVADKCFGTFQVPVTHPKYEACRERLKGWGAGARTKSEDVLPPKPSEQEPSAHSQSDTDEDSSSSQAATTSGLAPNNKLLSKND